MNEKQNIQNLTEELAEIHGLSKKNAESFVRDFFSLIEEALEKDKYVKVKGLGTFKLIDVDSRESINVNTGERFEIQGHSKITFTPDSSLKEVVNKPFSAFETVVLAEGVEIDAPEEEEGADADDLLVDEPVADVSVVDKPVAQEKTVAEEEPVTEEEAITEEEPVVEEEPAPAVYEEEAVPEEEPVPVEVPVTEDEPVVEDKPVVEEEPTVEEEPSVEEEPVAEEQPVKILPIFDDDEIKKRDQPVSHQEEVKALRISEEKRREISKKAEGSSTPYLMFIAVLIIIMCLGAVAYLYYPDLARKDEPLPVNREQIIKPVQPTETPVTETPVEESVSQGAQVGEQVNNNQPSSPAATPEATPQVAQTPAAAPATTNEGFEKLQEGIPYKTDGDLATHTLQKGETLNAIALKYYGTRRLYTYIVSYNKGVIKDPDNVPVGTVIKIPKLVKK